MSSYSIDPLQRWQGKALSEDEKWDIVRVMKCCKAENEASAVVSTKAPRQRAAAYLGVGKTAVARIYAHYLQYGTIPDSHPGNHTHHPTVVTDDLGTAIRHFLRERHLANRFTTATDVCQFVEERFQVSVNTRTMQRTLSRLGLEWCKANKQGRIYREAPDVVQKRQTYLYQLQQYRALPRHQRYREIWTDESYIHHHHSFPYSWYSATDVVGRRHKGRRLVILDAGSKYGSVPNALKVYCAQKPSGDYHGNISRALYYRWFTEQLLPNLAQKSLIIMDNASYHTALPESAPCLKATKAQIQQWLRDYQVTFEDYHLLDTLRQLLREQVLTHLQPAIVEAAETAGHKVLFQPPHHADLQAIELIWANAKGKVARQYDNATTLQDVEERLLEALIGITGQDWANAIDHVHKVEKMYWETDKLLYDDEARFVDDDDDDNNAFKEFIEVSPQQDG